jgi:hypothetical protein
MVDLRRWKTSALLLQTYERRGQERRRGWEGGEEEERGERRLLCITFLYIDFVMQNTYYIHLSTGNFFSITLILSTFSVGCQAQTIQ